jgi:hypothetical protein
MGIFKKNDGSIKIGPVTITTGEGVSTNPTPPAIIDEAIKTEVNIANDLITKIMETGIEIINEETNNDEIKDDDMDKESGEFSTEGRCKILIEIAVDDNKIFKGKTVYLSEDWTQLYVQYTEAKDGKELAALIEGKIQTTYLLTGNIVKTKEDILAGR